MWSGEALHRMVHSVYIQVMSTLLYACGTKTVPLSSSHAGLLGSWPGPK